MSDTQPETGKIIIQGLVNFKKQDLEFYQAAYDQLAEQTKALKSIRGSLNFFVVLAIISIIVQFLF